MVEYLQGGIIRGTKEQRGKTLFPDIGGWKEVGRAKLSGNSDNIDVTNLPDKRYYMILHSSNGGTSGFLLDRYRLNGDTGNNYAWRNSTNGAADATATSNSEGMTSGGGSIDGSGEIFTVSYLANRATNEKLMHLSSVQNDTTGATGIPDRQEGVGKHVQTTNPVNAVNCVNTNNNDFGADSEVVVLGWDEGDTHSENFWEELDSADLSGGASDTIDLSFTPKKYLRIQGYLKNSGQLDNVRLYLGNSTVDTNTNYSFRHSLNGAGDSTNTSIAGAWFAPRSFSVPAFFDLFIINIGTREKLIISDTVYQNTAGATNVPDRHQVVGKWVNTTDMANVAQIYNAGTGDFDTASTVKIWGAN